MMLKSLNETVVCPDEVPGLFIGWKVAIYDDRTGRERRRANLPEPSEDHERRVVRRVGNATVERFCFERAINSGEQIWEVTDAHSQEWHELYVAFMSEEGFKEGKGFPVGFRLDTLLIGDIALKDEYRGRGVEVGIADRLIETLGVGCGFVAYWCGDNLWEEAVYAPLGFTRSTQEVAEGFLCLDLERNLPEVQDLRWNRRKGCDPEQLYETWCPKRKRWAPIAPIVRTHPSSEAEADPKVLA